MVADGAGHELWSRDSFGGSSPPAGGPRIFPIAPHVVAVLVSSCIVIIDVDSLYTVASVCDIAPRRFSLKSLGFGSNSQSVYVIGDDHNELLVLRLTASLEPRDVFTARLEPADKEWTLYQASVAADERRIFVSYHGTDTTGVDWFDVDGSRLVRCTKRQRPNVGCISGAHGGFALVDGGLIVATGLRWLEEVDQEGHETRRYDTALEHTHLMQFWFEGSTKDIYSVSSCGSGGSGLSVIRNAGTIDSRGRLGSLQPLRIDRDFKGRSGDRRVCGEFVTATRSGAVAIARYDLPGPKPDRTGDIVFVNAKGSVTSQLTTPSEPVEIAFITMRP
jgi:hypothetical protein